MDINTQLFYSGYKCPEPNKYDLEKLKEYRDWKRIKKEIEILSKKYKVSLYEKDGLLEIVLKDEQNYVTLLIPKDYPFRGPSGTFNGRTISDVDIDWQSVTNNLKKIIDKLIAKKLKKIEILCYLN